MTKIEEMARAVYEKRAERERPANLTPWDGTPLMFRFALKQTMRDALAVLREPTEAMVAAVNPNNPVSTEWIPPSEVWQAMVDAILAEDPAR